MESSEDKARAVDQVEGRRRRFGADVQVPARVVGRGDAQRRQARRTSDELPRLRFLRGELRVADLAGKYQHLT